MAIDSEQIFEELRDVTVTSPSIPRILRKTCSPIALGLCLRLASVRNLLVGLPIRSSIQILHLRFTGEERIHHGVRREIVSELQKDLDRWPWSRTRRPKKSNAAGLDYQPARKAPEL
ncbi:hypothetical protein PHISCL_09088 [Aspergillus sclerotialis]|uniref:Uncharacterized protein n=1 Tax=Aspergillus sclerotialis TaxID=2070753 RepID=A0A3A2Z667_9EURO|nr:hypothetical protein PHISCL_09088 [Aspergillus sclerotialis]